MFKSNSTAFAASLILLCMLSACGGVRQTDIAPAFPEGKRDSMNSASSAEAVRIAAALHASGADADALVVIATAYRRFPNDAAVISAYGRLAAINGQDELAARLLHETLAIAPGDWLAWSARGVISARAGREEEARAAMMRARAASGSDAVALNNLAVNFILGGNAADAERLLRQALASSTLKEQHRQRVRHNLAVALAMQGNTTAAAHIAGSSLPPLRNADPATLRRVMGLAPAPPRDGEEKKAFHVSERSPMPSLR